VRQRGEIAGRAQRSLLGHDRVDTLAQQFQQRVDDQRAHTGEALGQRVGAHDQHGPHRRLVGQRADARRMAAQQVHLERSRLLRADQLLLERAEAGRDAIGDLARRHQPLHGFIADLDALLRLRAEGGVRPVHCHRPHVLHLQAFAVKHNRLHGSPCLRITYGVLARGRSPPIITHPAPGSKIRRLAPA